MTLLRTTRAALDMLIFEAVGVAYRGLIVAANVVNDTAARPR